MPGQKRFQFDSVDIKQDTSIFETTQSSINKD